MIDKKVAIPAIMCILVLAGAALAYVPDVYRHDLTFSLGDDGLQYEYESNVGSSTKTVMFSNTGLYEVNRVVLFLDQGYASKTDYYYQNEFAEDIRIQLSLRSICDFECADALELVTILAEAEPSRTAVMFASGTLPDVVYNGSPDCPLMKWLSKGGVIINISGCLGKYISHGPEQGDIEECQSYGMLFAGVDDASFSDSDVRVFASGQCNEVIRDSLDLYINECTFGIDISGMDNVLNLGYVSDEYVSSAVIFKSSQGMVINFGASLVNYVHFDHHIAQIIASGIDYSSELIQIQIGDTRGDNTGCFPIGDIPCTVYGFIGTPRAVYADRFIIS